jgi:hypothetical protein
MSVWAASGYARVQDPVVTIQLRAMSAQSVCKRLFKATGQTLDVVPPLASEIVLLDVQKVPLSEIRARLAHVLRGRWAEIKGGYRLSRPADIRKQLEKEDLERRVAWTKKLLDDERAKLKAGQTPFQRAEYVIEQIRNHPDAMTQWIRSQTNGPQPMVMTHGEILMRQLVTSMDPRKLALLPMGPRFDWSDRPGPMEMPLPPGSAKFLQEFKDTEAQIALLVDEEGRTNMPASIEGLFDTKFYFNKVLKPSKLPGGIGKLILNGARFMDRGYFFRMSVYTPTGEQRCQVGGTFYFSAVDDPRYRIKPPTPPQQQAEAFKGMTVEPTGLSKEFLEHSVHWDWVGATRPMPYDRPPAPSKELTDFVTQPEVNEPLALPVSDALLAAGRGTSRNVVACIPDSMHFATISAYSHGKIDLRGMFDGAITRRGIDIEQPDGWLLVRPYEPLSSELRRTSRAALGRLLRDAREKGSEPLKGVARFYWESWPGARTVISGSCRNVLIHGGGGSVFTSTESLSLDEPMALLGSLSDVAWKTLEAGDSVDLGALPQAQKTLLYTRACTFPQPQPGVPASPALQERTVARPNGPVPGIPATMRIDSVPAIIRSEPPVDDNMMDTLQEIPALVGWVGSSILSGDAKTVAEALPDQYYFGTYKRVRATIRFAPGYVLFDEWLCEPKLDRSGRGLSYSELPAAFRKELEKAVDAYVKQAKG